MKKITMICMAALLLLAASCKKENEGETNEPTGEESVFRVETEVHSGDGKTHIEGTDLVWDNTDAINVINGSGTSHVFQFSKYVDEGDKTTAEFGTTNLPDGFYKPNYTAYYPSDFNPSNYTMLQTQTYSADGFVPGANPMIATNEAEKKLHFKNVLGILELQLKSVDNSMTVKEIRVRSNNINEKLWGTGSVVNGEFKVSSGGSNTVKLNCGSVAINSTTPTSFFILLPPGTLSGGFEVDVVDTDGEFWIKKSENSNTIERSKIKRMPAVSVETCTSEYVQLWATADAYDHNAAPYWATKNLGAEKPWKYGDYYQWAATSTLYKTQPAQSGTGSVLVDFKEGLPSTGGYDYNKNAPYWDRGTQNSSVWTKYNSGNDILGSEDDVASILTGGKSHIPTYDEFDALITNTEQQRNNNYNSTAGMIFRGKGDYNDRFIFIPYAGEAGYYQGDGGVGWNHVMNRGSEFACWCNQLWSSKQNARAMFFYPTGGIDGEYVGRWLGCSIRPIRPNN